MASLLNVEQKRVYYNEILKTLISEVEAKYRKSGSQDILPHTILAHLRDSIEVEFCQPKLLAEVMKLSE